MKKQITLTRAINKDLEVIVKCDDLTQLGKESDARYIIENSVHTNMSFLTTSLIEELGHLGYIEFTRKITVWR